MTYFVMVVDYSTIVVYLCKQKMIDRIKQIMSLEQLSSSQFADTIKLQRSSLSHVLSGRNKPSLDFVMKIKTAFNRISLEWLLFGEGAMFIDQGEAIDTSAIVDDNLINDQPMLSFDTDSKEIEKNDGPQFGSQVEDEKPAYYGSNNKRIIILNADGTYEEFTK